MPEKMNFAESDAVDVITHYDLLIEENNDPFRDPPALQDYMNLWDGAPFLEAMELSKEKTVLEIGIGTGRIANGVAPNCLRLVGVDISPKTLERAKENLRAHSNISYICADFSKHLFSERFDVVYSSLTMMHFKDKRAVVSRVADLLNDGGLFCLSIDKNQAPYINMGTRKLQIYPDTLDSTTSLINETAMSVDRVVETEHAYLIVSRK